MMLEFTREAEGDLERIADYIAADNPLRALTVIRELRVKCEGLTDNPKRFALVPRYEQHGVRRRVHGNYVIFYRVEEDRVVILHVLHGATDYGSLLFDE
ncbi:type II toxin-antitoxin system RelE/ParE family toxin [Rhizobium sp. RU36D]|uniref:type II toxin-antitoxin system RelE/ParE family toxin n=1 Tax=Rhizobium sp. RU36D TaxID=1907415 RepID=UPI0009D83685|nr:type II toxin-antitoxin system RelE/ParE family toxin [Rhizobium sp. RU36D]SMC52686.1 addiction module toxin, RelE/StbE family [Rhizobium sp. RU36D]